MKILLICRQESEGAHALASCAEEHGFCVRLCFSCAEAERLLSRFMPDLAVFDAVLPDGDGLELLERWAGRTAARFICLTPFVNDFVLLSCKAYGAEYVLPQSMNAEMVMRRIMQIDAGAVDYIQPSADGEETRLNEAAARLLGSIGMQHGRLGFRYARCALLENGTLQQQAYMRYLCRNSPEIRYKRLLRGKKHPQRRRGCLDKGQSAGHK